MEIILVDGQDRVSYGYNPMMARSHAWYGGLEENVEERRFRKHYSAISPVEIIDDRETDNVKIITYIGGDAYDATIAHIKTKDNSVAGYHYLHRDYLGSVMGITNSSGDIVERAQFGAWGQVDKWTDGDGNALLAENGDGGNLLLGRGYTGHEHFFDVNLIHMNGRMYDAELGRFLSTDPFISDPFDTQNIDRYGYVMNNPLVLADYNGYEPFTILGISIWVWAATLGGSAILYFGGKALADGYADSISAYQEQAPVPAPGNNNSGSSMINDSPVPPWQTATLDPPLFRTNDFRYSDPSNWLNGPNNLSSPGTLNAGVADPGPEADGFSITTEDVLRTAADFTPFVGSSLDIYEGYQSGDGWQVAMGVGFLILDVATLGGSSIVKGVVKTGAKVGSRAIAKNAAKRGAKTWNQFQKATKGTFSSRGDAGAAWSVYKQANNIANGTIRSQAQKSLFLRNAAKSRKYSKGMNQWLRHGKVPPGYSVDHIKPLSIGGADLPSNMRLLDNHFHYKIHHAKGFYRPWEW